MNDKKQIEEMAKVISETERMKVCTHCELPSIEEYAKSLYNAGYRKQKVGRWVYNEDRNAYEARYFCSECLADGHYEGDDPFCWNCGAKMKGGAE